MEHEQIWVTRLLNEWLGGPITALLNLLGIHPENPHAPIPNYVAMEVVVFVIAVAFVLWFKHRLAVDRPGATQQCVEMIFTNPMGVGVRDLANDIIGHHGARYIPVLGSVGIFVLLCNLISIIPGFESPTADASVPLGCAAFVFLYYNWCGIQHHGALGYGKHFLGPSLPLAPLMLPIEIVSNLARMLSLTVRLWVNMLVSEMLYTLFLGMTLSLTLYLGQVNRLGYAIGVVPLLFPIIFILLHIFVAVLQAFVFTLLPIIYVGSAVEEAH